MYQHGSSWLNVVCCRNQVKKTTDFTRIQKLVLQISKEHKDKIRDDVLFGTGRDAGKTEFLKLIRMQYCVEICKMFESLEDELRLRARPGSDEKEVTVKNVKATFQYIDRRKGKKEVENWLTLALRSERNEEPLPQTTGARPALVN